MLLHLYVSLRCESHRDTGGVEYSLEISQYTVNPWVPKFLFIVNIPVEYNASPRMDCFDWP